MRKIVIITGIAGLIGSTLIKKIYDRKKIFITIDDLSLGKIKFIKNFLNKDNFYFLKKEINSKFNFNYGIRKIISRNKIDTIWHLVANSDIAAGVEDTRIDLNKTFLSTYYFLEKIKDYIPEKARLIFTSSSAVYGKINGKIKKNEFNFNPVSNYGAMKLASEAYISYLSERKKLNTHIFRLPNVVGENLTHGVIFDLIKKVKKKINYLDVLGNGTQKKPYAEVKDLIKLFLSYLKNNNRGIKKINLGQNDDGVTVNFIANYLITATKSNKKIRYEKKNTGWVGDINTYSYEKNNKSAHKFKLNSREAVEHTIDKIMRE